MTPYQEALDAHKGRCAVAVSALQAGKCVLRTTAICAVSRTCGWCFTFQVALQRCTGCRKARYCSRTCQQRDWSEHRHECSAWCSIPADSISPTVLLVTRLAARLFLSSSVTQIEKYRVLRLRHHMADHAKLKLKQFHEMTQLVLLLLSRYTVGKEKPVMTFQKLQNELESEILRLFGRVNCNAFSIANKLTNEEVGIGLFPEGALFNHDCNPNCIVSFEGREMLVHVIKDVDVSQELTISYVELLQSTKKRRAELEASYFFKCECLRCLAAINEETNDDWFLDGLVCGNEQCIDGVVVEDIYTNGSVGGAACKKCGALRNKEEIAEYRQELQTMKKRNISSEQEKWNCYQGQWKIALEKLRLHPRNAQVAVTAREIANFLLKATSVELHCDAINFCLAELHAVEWLLPHLKLPSRGLLHYQIGKLLYGNVRDFYHTMSPLNRIEQLEKAAIHLQESISVLERAWGSANAPELSALMILEEVQRTAKAIATD